MPPIPFLDLLLKAILFFAPPKENDPMQLYVWQWKSIAIGATALCVASYAASFIPWVKPSYALSADMETMKNELQGKLDKTNKVVAEMSEQLKAGQIRSLNTDLIDARRNQCRGINSEDKSSLQFWNYRIQSLKLDYYLLTRSEWPDLPCNSF